MKAQTSTKSQRKRGAIYVSLVRVGNEALTRKQIAERVNLTVEQVSNKIRKTRAKGGVVDWGIFGGAA